MKSHPSLWDAAKVLPPGFDAFWQAYPRHVGKQDAIKAWTRLRLAPDDMESLYQALEAQKGKREWAQNLKKGLLEFIPHAATWLNGRRFEDEDLKPSPVVRRWYDDCAERHQGQCQSQTEHQLRVIRDGLNDEAHA